MKEFIGKSVFSGIAIGKIAILKKDDQSVKRTHVEDTAGELARVNAAKSCIREMPWEMLFPMVPFRLSDSYSMTATSAAT